MNPKMIPKFDYKDCINCGICVQACPVSALSMTLRAKNGKYRNEFPEINDFQGCIGCKQCQTSCPMDCISMIDYEEFKCESK